MPTQQRRSLSFMALLLIILAACGGGNAPAAVPDGDTATGEQLFHQTQAIVSQAPTCQTCHVIEADAEPIVGPSLYGIANVADSRVPGMSAEEYLRETIVDPDAHIVEGYQSGIMVKTYGVVLSEEQIDKLVDYMLTLD